MKSLIFILITIVTTILLNSEEANATDNGPLVLKGVAATDSFCSIEMPFIINENGCQSKFVRWDCGTIYGENMLKLATTAYLAGHKTYVISEGCFDFRPRATGIQLVK